MTLSKSLNSAFFKDISGKPTILKFREYALNLVNCTGEKKKAILPSLRENMLLILSATETI